MATAIGHGDGSLRRSGMGRRVWGYVPAMELAARHTHACRPCNLPGVVRARAAGTDAALRCARGGRRTDRDASADEPVRNACGARY